MRSCVLQLGRAIKSQVWHRSKRQTDMQASWSQYFTHLPAEFPLMGVPAPLMPENHAGTLTCGMPGVHWTYWTPKTVCYLGVVTIIITHVCRR